VDYAVGIDRSIYPTDARLKDPGANAANLIAAQGSSNVSFAGGVVDVTGSNQIIDGYDFSLRGYGLQIDGPNCTISNCKIVTNTGSYNPISGTFTFTVLKSYIDQGGSNGIIGQAVINAGPIFNAGTHTIHYCYIRNAYAESIQIGNDITAPSGLSIDIRFNLIENAGIGFGPSSGDVHGDWVQMQPLSTAQVWPSLIWNYNTWLQFLPFGSTSAGTGARTQGISFAPTFGTIGSYTTDYNTVVGTSNAFVSFFTTVNNQQVSGHQSVSYNYLNLACPDLGSQPWLFVANDSGPYNDVTSITGNLNLATGNPMVLGETPPYT